MTEANKFEWADSNRPEPLHYDDAFKVGRDRWARREYVYGAPGGRALPTEKKKLIGRVV
jgi:hypothetical protein